MNMIVQMVPVDAVPPSLQDNTGDIDRLKRNLSAVSAVRPLSVPFSRLRDVAARFRKAGFKGVAVVNDMPQGKEIVDFLPAPPAVFAGMALDLGTTHLEASLVDFSTGMVLARATQENSQMQYGADILSRIHFAVKREGLDSLHKEVVDSINRLTMRLAEQAKIQAVVIRALTVSGNTTMVHFFLKLEPYHICREPYIPMVNTPDPCRAEELHLAIHPGAPVWVFPSVGSYFGGDLISGVLASGLDMDERTCMLIDVGTNAEVVVGNREWLIACAGAAGPALEGGVAKMGMRAGPGAIEHVSIDPDTRAIRHTTVDGGNPRGICGSGIIDLVAGLYLAKVIDIRGKFVPGSVPERLVEGKDGLSFIVATEEEAGGNEPVMLGQLDLDALMRSKAAMYAILTTLVNQVGLTFQELHHIYVAGAFGRHIAPWQAIVLGMLPDLPEETYVPVGNSSLAGAEKVLLDPEARSRVARLVKKITYVELNVNQEFMIRFSGSRLIPHTDHTLFPSVPFYK